MSTPTLETLLEEALQYVAQYPKKKAYYKALEKQEKQGKKKKNL